MTELLIVLAMVVVFVLGYSYGHDAGRRAERTEFFYRSYLRIYGGNNEHE